MSRKSAIEIHIDTTDIPQAILDKYDIEYYKEKETDTLWIHENGYKPFERELFNYMSGVKSVLNRRTNSDHLDLYIEAIEIDEFGIDTGTKKFKNIRWSEIIAGQIDMSKVILKKEVYDTSV
jgi:hypothetical protein